MPSQLNTVTVAVPYFGVPDLVERAVRSILAQTYRELRVIVVGDGEVPPLNVSDSRLTVYCLPQNRGTYFALQLALLASTDQWHAPHGADDWTDPEHLEKLMELGRDAVAMGTCWVHDPDPVLTSIGREGWHVGVYRSERLKAIGGYDPAARVSQDTHVLKLLDMTGGYFRHETTDPTYHVWRHPHSLTVQRATGMSSPARHRARTRDHHIRRMCRKLSPEAMREYRASLVPPALADELAGHVERLARCLA